MRGKADEAAFPRIVLAAIGYFRKTYETLTMRREGEAGYTELSPGGSVPFKTLAPAQTNYLWV